MRTTITTVLSASAFFACPNLPAFAQEDDLIDRTPRDCITTSRINYTRVVDADTILFYMIGGTIYRNVLPQLCPGLQRRRGFTYAAPANGRLCDVDAIRPHGVNAGRPCTLGQFQPITREESRMLQRDPDVLDAIDRSVETRQVEPPPEEGDTEP